MKKTICFKILISIVISINIVLQIAGADFGSAVSTLSNDTIESWPDIKKLMDENSEYEILQIDRENINVIKFKNIKNFKDYKLIDEMYFAYTIGESISLKEVKALEEKYYIYYKPLPAKTNGIIPYELELASFEEIKITNVGIVLLPASNQSKFIQSVKLVGDEKNNPIVIEKTEGDLWMNTWADDGNIYGSWGDGLGFIDKSKVMFTDLGFFKASGLPPKILGSNQFIDKIPVDRKEAKLEDDKPSSLIYVNDKLYSYLHSPLENPKVGYISFSEDYGITWRRLKDKSPWTIEKDSKFRCPMVINMGQNYNLNKDGYIYILGIGKEWGWHGEVYLARVKIKEIENYSKYEYFSVGTQGIVWVEEEIKATPIAGITAFQQFSVIYHPYLKRYIAMTNKFVFESQTPWGPWENCGRWTAKNWLGYQPAIFSKNLGENDFWFAISGQPDMGDEVPYKMCFGRIKLNLIK